MARYESKQTLIAFIRRLGANFGGFSGQAVPVAGGAPLQMSIGEIIHSNQKIYIAAFTRQADQQDCFVLSIPLFQIPQSKSEDLFCQLLSWNNGATETVHFAVDEPLNTINVVCFRPIEGLDFQEFHYCVDTMTAVARNSTAHLQNQFGLNRIA